MITASADPGSSFSLSATTLGYHQEGRGLSWGKILPVSPQDVTGEDKEACSGTITDNKPGQPVPRTVHSSRFWVGAATISFSQAFIATSQKEGGDRIYSTEIGTWHTLEKDGNPSPCSWAGAGSGASSGQPRTGRELWGCAEGLARRWQIPACWQGTREDGKFGDGPLQWKR